MRRFMILLSLLASVVAGSGVLGPKHIWAQQTLQNLAAADHIYQDFPELETLATEEVEPWLAVWDEAVLSADVRALKELFRDVELVVPRGYRLGRFPVLRYANPEIVGRVTDLYNAEFELRAYTFDTGVSRVDLGLHDPSLDHEVFPNYLESLATLALSTFSPDIYETALKWGYGGKLHTAYLSSVYPETTLQLILETTLGERDGKQMNADTFYHSNADVSFGSIESVFELLSVLGERSPDVILRSQERVETFIQEHALYYATPRLVGSKPEPKYLWRQDHEVRVLALRSLELLSQVRDVYTIVDNIMGDVPDNPDSNRGNEITEMGTRIIEEIQALR